MGSLCLGTASSLPSDQSAPDRWVEDEPRFPAGLSAGHTNGFATLHGEAIAGKIKIVCADPSLPTNATLTLWYSFDAPGRWQARAWRATPMITRAGSWDFSVPLVHLDLPLVYFVTAALPDGRTNVSAMRICQPRLAGVEEITRPFWPFLEGFEEGLDNWRWHSDAAPPHPLTLHTNAYHGYYALRAALPAGRRRAVLATTVVRGWHLDLFNARGLGLWVRTLAGEGTLRFSFITSFATTNQVVHPYSLTCKAGPQWSKLEVLFDNLPPQSRGQLDLVTIELEADEAREFLFDDLHLLGRWRLDLE